MRSNRLAVLFLIYSSHRLILIICSITFILIIITKSLCRSKLSNNMNITLFNSPSSDKTLKKQKAEKQLLYETIFVCFWKGVNGTVSSSYYAVELAPFGEFLLTLVMDLSVYLSNVGGLIVLILISGVARKGVKQAFRMRRNALVPTGVTPNTRSTTRK